MSLPQHENTTMDYYRDTEVKADRASQGDRKVEYIDREEALRVAKEAMPTIKEALEYLKNR